MSEENFSLGSLLVKRNIYLHSICSVSFVENIRSLLIIYVFCTEYSVIYSIMFYTA